MVKMNEVEIVKGKCKKCRSILRTDFEGIGQRENNIIAH